MCVYIYICVYVLCICTCIRIRICACEYVYVYRYVYIYLYTHVCIYWLKGGLPLQYIRGTCCGNLLRPRRCICLYTCEHNIYKYRIYIYIHAHTHALYICIYILHVSTSAFEVLIGSPQYWLLKGQHCHHYVLPLRGACFGYRRESNDC